ncbi:MAG: YdcF family protein [Lentisphaerae bacterium]|nr:YdcF family protein [Lentisphaerota bacterium]
MNVALLTWVCNPFSVAVALAVAVWRCLRPSGGASAVRRRKAGRTLSWILVGWMAFWTQPLLVNLIGTWLEAPYPYVAPEGQPTCDVIVLLGGGMGRAKWAGGIPEMFGSADRVWHAARLWRAGRARYIIASGNSEEGSSVPLLLDLGVPRQAILVESQAKSTLQNGLYVRRLIDERGFSRRVLLVTSAWHMRRSEMIFRGFGLEPVPAAVDHEASYGGWKSVLAEKGVTPWHILPSVQAMASGCVYVKECQGLLGDRLRVSRAKRERIHDGL